MYKLQDLIYNHSFELDLLVVHPIKMYSSYLEGVWGYRRGVSLRDLRMFVYCQKFDTVEMIGCHKNVNWECD